MDSTYSERDLGGQNEEEGFNRDGWRNGKMYKVFPLSDLNRIIPELSKFAIIFWARATLTLLGGHDR